MKIEIEVQDELISNLLTSAFQGGGSNYWLRSTRCEINGDQPALADRTAIPLVPGGRVFCTLKEEAFKDKGLTYTLDRAGIEKGLLIMKSVYPRHFGDAIAENDDATTGDVFLQCCLFGEVVFG